jgi:Rieske Fe-S protein
MDRKEFIKGSCGVCIALGSGVILSSLLQSCGTKLTTFKTSSKENEVIIPLTEFQESNFKLVRVSNYDYDVAVQKQPNGSYRALVLKCTHAGHPLTKTGNSYYCSLHGSQFSNDGQVLKGPAEKDLTQLATRMDSAYLHITLREA